MREIQNQRIHDQVQHGFKRLNALKRWAVRTNVQDPEVLQAILGLELNIRSIQSANLETPGEVAGEDEEA